MWSDICFGKVEVLRNEGFYYGYMYLWDIGLYVPLGHMQMYLWDIRYAPFGHIYYIHKITQESTTRECSTHARYPLL